MTAVNNLCMSSPSRYANAAARNLRVKRLNTRFGYAPPVRVLDFFSMPC
jgi:hypothetical protein